LENEDPFTRDHVKEDMKLLEKTILRTSVLAEMLREYGNTITNFCSNRSAYNSLDFETRWCKANDEAVNENDIQDEIVIKSKKEKKKRGKKASSFTEDECGCKN